MSPLVPDEVCNILVLCTHRTRKVREASLAYAKQVLEGFAALLCDRKVVFTLLEILTLLRRSCEYQYTDEVRPSAFGVIARLIGSTRPRTSSSRTRWI